MPPPRVPSTAVRLQAHVAPAPQQSCRPHMGRSACALVCTTAPHCCGCQFMSTARTQEPGSAQQTNRSVSLLNHTRMPCLLQRPGSREAQDVLVLPPLHGPPIGTVFGLPAKAQQQF